ncbi:tRNA lysidine(34) synthetase TilS [Apilactobacillus apinorum]|uniref:tRNA(Ile)-lysidine synthase n=1 Tax=Apilactobacillus apinorum TaxID=1218495 RepID=A0ABP9ZI35_9LACO
MVKPEKLQQRFNLYVKNKNWFTPKQTVVIGVSAGVDSMSLLNLMMNLPAENKTQIVVAHVNHQLREVSDEEEQYVKTFCDNHGLTLKVAHWDIENHPQNGVEESARKFRYDFFLEVLKKYHGDILITAHHENDQSETVLMRLIRGTFINHLSGIKSVRDFHGYQLVRPLLHFKKQELKQYALDNAIIWYEDETNQDLAITRNRMRHQLIPLIEKENPQGVAHIADFADQVELMQKQNEYLIKQIIKQIDDEKRYDLNQFLSYPEYIQQGIIDLILNETVPNQFNLSLIKQIMQLLNNRTKPQGQVQLAHNFVIKKQYNYFFVEKIVKKQISGLKNECFVVTLNQWYSGNHFKWMLTDKSDYHDELNKREATIYLSDEQFPITVQPTKNDDKVTLKDGGHQMAKRVFINGKVPIKDRKQSQTLVDSSGKILAILGYRESVFSADVQKQKYVLIIK